MPEPTRTSSDAPEPGRRWDRFRRPAMIASGAAALLVAVAAILGVNVLLTLGEHRTVDVEVDPPSDFAKGPRNVLVLGSDSRVGLTPEELAVFGDPKDLGEGLSDTIILLHVDPRRERAVVIHFPRDLRVAIPEHGVDKINAAYGLGGPSLVVQTVKRFTGLPVHNYVEVDLAGFQDVVDALGGVRMCVSRPLHDERAGLAVPKAGCYIFDGQTALAFVRARNIEGDLIPDFSRISRQQQFMRAMMNRLLSVRSLLDADVIQQAVGNVTTDTKLSGADLLLLGSKLRELSAEDPSGVRSLDFRVVPSTPAELEGVAYVLAEQPDTNRLFEALADGRPLGEIGTQLASTLPSPGIITVSVRSDDEAALNEAGSLLKGAGFVVLGGTVTDASEEPAILYGTGERDRGTVVSSYFPDLPLREAPPAVLHGNDVVVVVDSTVAEAG
jgi:LCP family protein required for cell wall assembly